MTDEKLERLLWAQYEGARHALLVAEQAAQRLTSIGLEGDALQDEIDRRRERASRLNRALQVLESGPPCRCGFVHADDNGTVVSDHFKAPCEGRGRWFFPTDDGRGGLVCDYCWGD